MEQNPGRYVDWWTRFTYSDKGGSNMPAKNLINVLLTMLIILALLLPLSACSPQTESPEKETIKQIACGDEFTLILYDTGKVRAVGKNTSGQLGVGDFEDRYELTEVLLPEAIARIGASDDCAYALSENGTLYVWGDNRYRQAADTSDLAVCTPTPRSYGIRRFLY